MFLIFRTTPLVVRCMAAVPLVATALYFFLASKSMIFNQLIQFGEDGLSSWANSNVKTTQLANGFCFLIGKPTTQNQVNLFWNICCFIKMNIKQLSFLQLVKKLFQQIWNMKTSTFSCIDQWNFSYFGNVFFFSIETAFFPPSTMTFWRCFKECLWFTLMSVESCDLTRFWDVLEPNDFYQIGCIK